MWFWMRTIFFHLHENYWFYYLILLYQGPLDSAGLQSSTWMSWWSQKTWKHWLQITWGPCRWLLLTWMALSTSTLRSVSRQHHVLWMELVTSHTTGAILHFCLQMFLIFRSLGVCVFSCNLLPALSAQDQDILHATLLTRGWNGYWVGTESWSWRRKLLLLPQGLEPVTFQSQVHRANHWAVPTDTK